MALVECKSDTLSKRSGHSISLKNVMYATDFSEASKEALPYATAISRRFGSMLHIAHVISDTSLILMTGGVDYVTMGTLYDDARAEAQKKIEELTSRLEEIPLQTYLRHGMIWKNLEAIIAEKAIDLLVVGTHGRTGVGGLLMGSVAEGILRHAQCPVLTVGPEVSGRARLPVYGDKARDLAPVGLELERILYATNFTPASLLVGEVACELAEEFDSRLTAMHVLENYEQLGSRPEQIEAVEKQLHEAVPGETKLAYAAEILVEFGSPAERIVKAAAEREADLIVLGARPTKGTSHLPWTIVHQVVAHAPCPVLTVCR